MQMVEQAVIRSVPVFFPSFVSDKVSLRVTLHLAPMLNPILITGLQMRALLYDEPQLRRLHQPSRRGRSRGWLRQGLTRWSLRGWRDFRVFHHLWGYTA